MSTVDVSRLRKTWVRARRARGILAACLAGTHGRRLDALSAISIEAIRLAYVSLRKQKAHLMSVTSARKAIARKFGVSAGTVRTHTLHLPWRPEKTGQQTL